MRIPTDIKIISILMILTGFGAFICSLYSWGNGFFFQVPFSFETPIVVGDLLINAPLSILAGISYYRGKKYGMVLALMTAGVYIYGSIQVYAIVFHHSIIKSLPLAIPPLFGLILAISILVITHRRQHLFK